jgi:NADH-quinone oxidoreductase subunit D
MVHYLKERFPRIIKGKLGEVLPPDERSAGRNTSPVPFLLRGLAYIAGQRTLWPKRLDEHFYKRVVPDLELSIRSIGDISLMTDRELERCYRKHLALASQHIEISKWGLGLYSVPSVIAFDKFLERHGFTQDVLAGLLNHIESSTSEATLELRSLAALIQCEEVTLKRFEKGITYSELNRIASHFIAIGTYGLDIGAFTPFLWIMRDREHIQRLLEWVSGARMLYNYIWIGGLFYDLPVGFEEQCIRFSKYLKPKLDNLEQLLIDNKIFIDRTAKVGTLPLDLAVNFGITGPMLRASGLKYDLRKVDAYSVYPEIDFDVPVGTGKMGEVGDCWDRTWVRMQECRESLKIIDQCLEKLTKEHKRTRDFDPRSVVPKKIRPKEQDFYIRAENPKGELGFFFRADGRSDIPFRCKARACTFVNLSILPELSRGVMISDLIAIIGSLDLVLGEIDR